MAGNSIRVGKEVFEWIRDEQYRRRKREGSEPTQGAVVASLIASYERAGLTVEPPGELSVDEAAWCDMLIKILRSGNADAIMAVTSNLRVFTLFIQQHNHEIH